MKTFKVFVGNLGEVGLIDAKDKEEAMRFAKELFSRSQKVRVEEA